MFRPGELVDQRYRVVREIGRGGFGTVYAADELDREDVLGLGQNESAVLRRVALKTIDQSCEPRRFGAEVRALCRLAHPCIVTVFGWGHAHPPDEVRVAAGLTRFTFAELAPKPYIAMELVDGAPMSESAGDRALAAYGRTLGQLIRVAEALAHAHERQVVHRDLKPQNILVDATGLPRIVDFGLAALLRGAHDASQHVGTPGFLAPELLGGDDVRDHRVDIYSFGATVYAMFAGVSPFGADDANRVLGRQLARAPIVFPDTFPHALRDLVSRCLDRQPTGRPRTAAAIADELRRLATAPGIAVSGADAPPAVDAPRVDVRDAVLRHKERFDHPTRGPGVRFALQTAGASDAPHRAFAYAPPPERSTLASGQVYASLSWSWPGVEVSLYGAKPVARTDGARFLVADDETLPVLMPYFPVTVTEVAKVDGTRSGPCATRALVDMRRPRDRSPAAVVGSLAHAMLERLVAEGSATPSFDRLFDATFPEQRLEAAASGMTDADVDGVRVELRQHFANLAEWMRPDADTRRGALAEARRVSARYGLEGRIDLILTDGDRVRILELKTGKYASSEHTRQLQLYTLMWDDLAARDGRVVSGTLLYSKNRSVRPVARGAHTRDRGVIVARNHLVAMHRWFSDGDTLYRPPSHGEEPLLCGDDPCRFRAAECKRQCALLGDSSGAGALQAPVGPAQWGDAPADLVTLARAYYFHFLRLIEREYRSVSLAMGDVYRRETLPDRVARQRAIADVTLVSIDGATGRVTLGCQPQGVFDVDDLVVVHRGDFDAEPALFGQIVAQSAGGLVVRCAAPPPSLSLPEAGWVVDEDVMRIGFSTMHRALFGLLDGGNIPRLRALLMPQARAAARRAVAAELDAGAGSTLNEDQRRAVAAALRDEPMLLVQGPPGTGKTTVIAEIACRLASAGRRVLVTACTHTAVNNALTRIVAHGGQSVLRVGGLHAVSAELRGALAAAGLDATSRISEAMGRAATTLAEVVDGVCAARVVGATTNACGTDPVFDLLRRHAAPGRPPFDVVIVDEASQLTEPLVLAALNLGDRFVLVGDEQQLPPVVVAPDAVTAHVGTAGGALGAAGVAGLDRSLFERLKPFAPHVMLRTQYRMNDGVQRVPNLAFYDSRLVASPETATRRLRIAPAALEGLDPELRRRIDPDLPSVWVVTRDPGAHRVHEAEAAAVAETVGALVRALQASGAFHRDAVGVVSPFRAQVHAIRAHLARRLQPDIAEQIEVDTVERFQGREKDAMLVSLVATRWSEFAMNEKRLNVALTRARSKAIVFGSQEVAQRLVDHVTATSTSRAARVVA